MNTNNLDKVISNYIEDIPNSYDVEHDELFKWRAVKHFQDNWNIDAENFLEMLKEATSETSIFVNNSTVQPLIGLIKVAEHDEKIVKNVFVKLDECNSKSIEERQKTIEECLQILNNEIKKYFGESWKYKQEKRTIILYLTMMHPEDNYFYKSTEAMNMAKCIEYDDLSSGSNFKLESYYNMCEQIRDYISNNQELLSVHKSYLDDRCYQDENLHLLVFNIIYCANCYGYYVKNNISLKSIKSYSKKKQKEIQDFAEIEKLEGEKRELIIKLSEKNDILTNMDEINVNGKEVEHLKFGKGKVINQIEESLTVEFSNGDVKKFILPIAFSKDYLKTSDSSIKEECIQLEKRKEEKEKIENDLATIEKRIEMLKNRYGIAE